MADSATSDAWAPFCAAVECAVDSDASDASTVDGVDAEGVLSAVLEDGTCDDMPLSELLRLRGFPRAEAMALDACRGRVLDVGAGAGTHALYLQQEGVEVTTLDAERRLVDLALRRGVRDARHGDIFHGRWSSPDERWDTALLLMNGTGLCARRARLEPLLRKVRSVLGPSGVVLTDGCDLRRSRAPEEAERIALRRRAGRGFGEARMHMEFSAASGTPVVGAPFAWLYADYDTLAAAAQRAGFAAQCIFDAGDEYLARLVVH